MAASVADSSHPLDGWCAVCEQSQSIWYCTDCKRSRAFCGECSAYVHGKQGNKDHSPVALCTQCCKATCAAKCLECDRKTCADCLKEHYEACAGGQRPAKQRKTQLQSSFTEPGTLATSAGCDTAPVVCGMYVIVSMPLVVRHCRVG